jgi:hypothetical protein
MFGGVAIFTACHFQANLLIVSFNGAGLYHFLAGKAADFRSNESMVLKCFGAYCQWPAVARLWVGALADQALITYC